MTEEVTRLDVDTMGVAFCQQFDVTLNGRPQKDCLIADSKRGYVKRYVRHYGVLAITAAGHRLTEEKRGVVTITKRST